MSAPRCSALSSDRWHSSRQNSSKTISIRTRPPKTTPSRPINGSTVKMPILNWFPFVICTRVLNHPSLRRLAQPLRKRRTSKLALPKHLSLPEDRYKTVAAMRPAALRYAQASYAADKTDTENSAFITPISLNHSKTSFSNSIVSYASLQVYVSRFDFDAPSGPFLLPPFG